MKMIKYIFWFTIIGFIVGVVISIGIVGFKCSDVDSWDCKRGCKAYFMGIRPDNCFFSCFEGCFEGCERGCSGCNTGDNCGEWVGGCIGGCIDGWSSCETCIDFEIGCESCTKYCNLCNETRKDDIKHAYNDIKDNSKAKNYIIYLTLIGSVIGFVFGTVSIIQDKRKQHQEVESNKKKLKQEAEDNMKKVEQEAERNRKARKQIAEDKWKELQDRLNNH